MTKFKSATIPPEEHLLVIADLIKKWEAGDPEIRKLFPTVNRDKARREIEETVTEAANSHDEVYLNDTYQVGLCRIPFIDGDRANKAAVLIRLSIRRLDRAPIHDWRDLQAIKNELVGPECEAVELYPAESRLVDTANQYWLWCYNDPTYRFPFGFSDGRRVSYLSVGKSVNRPRTTTE